MDVWIYPDDRYYYDWYDQAVSDVTDDDITSNLKGRLTADPLTTDFPIEVFVDQQVVTLSGQVGSSLAKRVAGDDAWDTPGVINVHNLLWVNWDL
jgi:osmotically-inducible protein OsmY